MGDLLTNTGNIGGQVATALDTRLDAIDSALALLETLRAKLSAMIEADGPDWRFDANALEQAPAGGGGGGGGTDWTSEEREIIFGKIMSIGSGYVRGSSSVAPSGNIVIPLLIGDDYLTVNGRSFSWTVPAVPGVVAATSVATFAGLRRGGSHSWSVTGTITVNGSEWVLNFEIPRTVSNTLIAGLYDWSVQVTSVDLIEVTNISGRPPALWMVKQT
jgi:hypothetical protein